MLISGGSILTIYLRRQWLIRDEHGMVNNSVCAILARLPRQTGDEIAALRWRYLHVINALRAGAHAMSLRSYGAAASIFNGYT